MISKKILKILLYISTRAVLYKFKPKVINITGSVGKTSTKEFTAELLASKFKILKTKYTQNTEFSVPTNILQIP
ncbi:MAG TPA: UDP-N-acetylmuramoyl-tripeptide--D-alanyl-D-alanine ligase, partial [Candidatus Latescibacteria bacterium]|nr:UDP-N-acetylmuramoyl-tripeptide--D-alanyl-D-alanine ligase [Candidatus Latescibacterota bacterium]